LDCAAICSVAAVFSSTTALMDCIASLTERAALLMSCDAEAISLTRSTPCATASRMSLSALARLIVARTTSSFGRHSFWCASLVATCRECSIGRLVRPRW
jgi:hypothetical protein